MVGFREGGLAPTFSWYAAVDGALLGRCVALRPGTPRALSVSDPGTKVFLTEPACLFRTFGLANGKRGKGVGNG